ncbi:MAG: heavy-metal-associated domain-containing protein [Bacteroidales bacterium]|nr:heavy-metal-associated domain-containing protein [Bacteroidales bacterium]
MKTRLVNLVVMLLIGATAVFAQSKTDKFKVSGNCDMCKNRIEKAAMAVDGVSKADWNSETKMIELSFESSKTDAHKVQMAIAMAGYDTEMHKASDKAYNALPGCCQYERTSSTGKKDEHKGHMH